MITLSGAYCITIQNYSEDQRIFTDIKWKGKK